MAIDITNHRLSSSTHNTYTVTFDDDDIFTTVTADATIVSRWISEILFVHRQRYRSGKLIAGLDVEWRPSSSRVQNPAATVQICIGRRCLIYQIIHSGGRVPRSLADFLTDDDITFVGVGVKDDMNILDRDYGIGNEARAVDLRWLAAEEYRRSDMRNYGLKDLAWVVLEKEVVKPRRVTLSNWENRRLSDDQVQYACVDAYVSFELGKVLHASDY